MAIDVFDFIHSVADTYPQSSVNVRFGGGYQYSTNPLGPDQIIFICTFRAMQWFLDDDGLVDATTNEIYNMRALQIFYENNGTHKTFIYLHPVRGPVFCKFESPLQTPKTLPGGSGVTESCALRLIYQPKDPPGVRFPRQN